MNILYNADAQQLDRQSSIDQFQSFLAVYKQGGAVPIAYDVIDSITCDGIKSHKAIMTDDPSYNGYIYPIAHCRKNKIEYLLSDERGVIEKELPKCQGSGTYQEYVDREKITNADNEALGVANKIKYRIGLDYYTAQRNLDPVD